MTLSKLLSLPCTLTLNSQASTTENDYGDLEPVDAPTVETVCELQQRQRSEPGAEGELSDSMWLLILPAGTAFTTGDMATIDGVEYQVIGEPWAARNPRTGTESHVEATVRRTAGAEEGS